MHLLSDYAIPLYLSLNRQELGESSESFSPFMANDEASRFMKTWLLYCCKCIQPNIISDQQTAGHDAINRIQEYLGGPTFPYLVSFPGHKHVTPFAVLLLERMCIGPIESELQLPGPGGYMVFTAILGSVLQPNTARRFLIDVLYERMKIIS